MERKRTPFPVTQPTASKQIQLMNTNAVLAQKGLSHDCISLTTDQCYHHNNVGISIHSSSPANWGNHTAAAPKGL